MAKGGENVQRHTPQQYVVFEFKTSRSGGTGRQGKATIHRNSVQFNLLHGQHRPHDELGPPLTCAMMRSMSSASIYMLSSL